MGTGFSKKKKQMRQMQEQMAAFQKKMQETEATGTSGNGLVTVILTGDYSMKTISIKPDCVDPEDTEGLEDLIQLAYQDALKQLQNQMPSGMPGMDFGF